VFVSPSGPIPITHAVCRHARIQHQRSPHVSGQPVVSLPPPGLR